MKCYSQLSSCAVETSSSSFYLVLGKSDLTDQEGICVRGCIDECSTIAVLMTLICSALGLYVYHSLTRAYLQLYAEERTACCDVHMWPRHTAQAVTFGDITSRTFAFIACVWGL